MKTNLLVLEDDPFTQQFYQILFDRVGYQFTITDDGNKFFEILNNQVVSLIILDINLKNTYLNNFKVDGIQIAKKIKSEIEKSQIPILLVTAYQNKINGRNFIEESQADDYILKPIADYNDFINKIEKLKLC